MATRGDNIFLPPPKNGTAKFRSGHGSHGYSGIGSVCGGDRGDKSLLFLFGESLFLRKLL